MFDYQNGNLEKIMGNSSRDHCNWLISCTRPVGVTCPYLAELCLFHIPIYCLYLARYLPRSRCTVNICWMNECEIIYCQCSIYTFYINSRKHLFLLRYSGSSVRTTETVLFVWHRQTYCSNPVSILS